MASESSPLLQTTSSSSPTTTTTSTTRRSPVRTKQTQQNIFTRPFPSAVTYDLSTGDQATIRLPPGSTWTSGPHWHDTHTEFLQVIKGSAKIILGYGRPPRRRCPPGTADEDRNGDGDGDEDEGKGVTVMPCVTPLDGVIIIPRGTVHEWRRSSRSSSNRQTRLPPDGEDEDGGEEEDEEEELVVREWTDPKDGQKESFFRNLNGIILDALAAEAALSPPPPPHSESESASGDTNKPDSAASGGGSGGAGPRSWQLRTLELELNNLFWRRDNWPLVLEREGRWPGWAHGVATRTVLLGSVVLGKVLGCKGVYEEYEK